MGRKKMTELEAVVAIWKLCERAGAPNETLADIAEILTLVERNQWLVLYSRIPTNYNPQCKLIVEAATKEDARAVARDHLGDTGKTLSTYHIESVTPYTPDPVRGRVVGGGR